MDDLRTKLLADEKLQIAQETDRIEIFGAKLRFAEVSIWGLILLGSVLFYLSLHLGKLVVEVAAGTTPDLASPEWIGLYKTIESKAFLLLSLVALPVAVSSLLVSRIWSASVRVEKLAYAVGLVTVLVLVASTTRRLIKLWKAIR